MASSLVRALFKHVAETILFFRIRKLRPLFDQLAQMSNSIFTEAGFAAGCVVQLAVVESGHQRVSVFTTFVSASVTGLATQLTKSALNQPQKKIECKNRPTSTLWSA